MQQPRLVLLFQRIHQLSLSAAAQLAALPPPEWDPRAQERRGKVFQVLSLRYKPTTTQRMRTRRNRYGDKESLKESRLGEGPHRHVECSACRSVRQARAAEAG